MSICISSTGSLDNQSTNTISGSSGQSGIGCTTHKVVRVSSTTTYYLTAFSSIAQAVQTPFMNAVRIA